MNRACSVCGGLGYTIGRRGELAWATACECTRACEICGGDRFVLRNEGGYTVATPCECLNGLERVRLYNEAGVPAEYREKTISGFENRGQRSLTAVKERLLRLLHEGIQKRQRGVLLVGEPGLGKTHLLCALVNHLTLQDGVAARFVDFFELTARIRGTYDRDSRGGESEASLMEPLVTVPVLAIDDLGKGRRSGFELTVIDRIITRCYNAGRVLFASTNFYPEAMLRRGGGGGEREPLEERIGQRLFSRLAEMTDIVTLTGQDYRLTHKHR